MTPAHFKTIMRDIDKQGTGDGTRPVCAFLLRCGRIYTGHWVPLQPACNVLVVTLVDKEAPPIYLSVVAIDAVAVDGIGAP